MPTYEYSCEKCGKHFDAFQSMRDEAFKTCPKDHCQMEEWGEGTVKRLLGTGAGLIFKGSGFYITDYRSNNYKEGAKKDSSASTAGDGGSKTSSSESSGSSSGPTTPAKATEAKPAEAKPKKDAAG